MSPNKRENFSSGAPSEDGLGMISWADAIDKLPGISPELKVQLREPRVAGARLIELLDLPRQKSIRMPLQEFLSAPDEHLNKIPSDRFYVRAEKHGGEPKMTRKVDITKAEVIDFSREIASIGNPEEWELTACEYHENVYGGNIVIDLDGGVSMEFRSGSQGPISSGVATPEYHVTRKLLGNSFNYSFEDPNLRRIAWSVIKEIPHDGDNLLPGYYEFQIWQREKGGPFEPIFIDYRDNPLYNAQNKNPNQEIGSVGD